MSGDEDRREYCLEIMARLRERSLDIEHTPLTLQMVQAVLRVRHEMENEERLAEELKPREETDDKSSEVLLLLSKSGVPAGALDRVKAINDAYELAGLRESLRRCDIRADDGEYDNRRTEFGLEIVARLIERGQDTADMPLTLQSVQTVLGIGDEITNEQLLAKGLKPMEDIDNNSFNTLLFLAEHGLPPGGLTRVEAINDANEAVCFEEFFQNTANSDAYTWDEHMNRGNARGQLGRYKEALEDYATAESLAEQPRDRAMIAQNRVHLLLKLAEGGEDAE